MSISVATFGIYKPCCPQEVPSGGGGVFIKEEEEVKPLILVKGVKYEKNGKINPDDLITVKSIT
jgi:hypothetical protein